MRNKDTDELMIFACEQNALVDVYAVETNEDCFVIVSSDPDKLDIAEFEGVEVKHRKGTIEEALEYERRISAELAEQNYQAFIKDH